MSEEHVSDDSIHLISRIPDGLPILVKDLFCTRGPFAEEKALPASPNYDLLCLDEARF